MLFSNKYKLIGEERVFRSFRKLLFQRRFTVVVLLLSLVFLISCGDSASDRADQVGGITARQIIENPAAYVGKTVTVTGEVEEIYEPRAFSMDSGLTVGELLVVGRDPYPQVPEAGNRAYVVRDTATVTGVVRMMVTAEVERELGWDLAPEIEAEYNAKPVLIVQKASFRPGTSNAQTGSVQTTPAGTNMTQTGANTDVTQPAGNTMGNQSADNTGANTSANTNTGQSGASNRITNVGAYASTRDKLSLANREAQFSNARVVRVVGPRTFTIASGNEEIYVMLDDESARGVGTQGKIGVGDRLSISGRFERLTQAEVSAVAGNRFRELTEQERAFMKNTQVYLQANEVSRLK